MSKRWHQRWLPLVLVGLAAASGCKREDYPESLRYQFQPHPSYDSGKDEQQILDLDGAARADVDEQLREFFGTPRDPIVKVSDELINNPELRFDPAILKEGSKLYRRYCLHCHGIVGDGNGPTGAFLNPRPRDFRAGKFKFRSTVRVDPVSKKPTTGTVVTPSRADLIKTLKLGVPTAAMPSFNLLDEETELGPIVSYLIHLSLRGQVEKTLATFPPDDLAVEVGATAERWVYGGRKGRDEKMAYPAPRPPASFVSTDTGEVMQRFERGKKLYLDFGGCVQCHGKDGRSNVMETPTNKGRRNDWGDLNVPRNLTFGYFRGGSRPLDLYYRLRLGIAGSGMPAAADVVTDEDLWYLVDYVLALPSQQR